MCIRDSYYSEESITCELQDADRPASAAKLQSRGSRSVADTSQDLARQQQRLPQPSLQFVTSGSQSAMTSAVPPRDKPVPFEAWTDDNQFTRGMANDNIVLRSFALVDGCISSLTRYCVVFACAIFIFSSAV